MKTIAGLGWHVKHHSSRKTPSKPRDPDQGMNRQLATRNFVPVEGNRLISFVGGETEKRIVKYPAHVVEDSTIHGPFDPPYGPVFNPSRDTQRYLVRVITASFFCSDRHDHATFFRSFSSQLHLSNLKFHIIRLCVKHLTTLFPFVCRKRGQDREVKFRKVRKKSRREHT